MVISKLERACFKTLMMLSYVSWIYAAMPASENGKIVGCGLLIIIFFYN